MPAETERYRFVRWEIEDAGGIVRTLPDGYADVTRGGGMKYERVLFAGRGDTVQAELHLKRGHVRKLEQFGFATRVPDSDSA